LGDLAGDARSAALQFASKLICLLRSEFGSSCLLVAKIFDKGDEIAELDLNLVSERRIRGGDGGLDVRVRDVQAMEDAANVGQTADAHEAALVTLLTRDEDRFLPLLEVAAHRRDHDHQRGEGVTRGWLPSLYRLLEFPRRRIERARPTEERVRLWHRLAELDRTVAIHVNAQPDELIVGAPRTGSVM
jgi:hypothetical protein